MQGNNGYIISGGLQGKKRLDILADVLKGYTKPLLEANGLTTGCSFLDVGCGGGSVVVMAARATGEKGNVTGIDFDDEIIALDKQDAESLQLGNITYHAQSAYDINYLNQFDVVYSRFLLSHLTNPLNVLNNMVNAAKPGGHIIVEDIQFSGHFCYPHNNAFEQYVNLFTKAAQQRGQNANIGPQLVAMFYEAGIIDVHFDVIQPAFNTGAGKHMAVITMEKIKDAVIKEAIADAQTIDGILQQLEDFTHNPKTIISLPRIFRVWGRKSQS